MLTSRKKREFISDTTGSDKKRRARIVPVIIISCVAVAIISVIIAIAILRPWVPSSEVPIIDIGDGNSQWGETVDMLPEKVYPGGEGEYFFKMKNSHDDAMTYSFDIREIYNGKHVEDFPIEFRFIKDGEPWTEYWYSSEELSKFTFTVHPQEKYDCGIQWRWKFESGDDERDTLYGIEGGSYALDILIKTVAVVY